MNPTRRQIFEEWFRLARPFSLTAAAVPVFFGTALAFKDDSFAWGPFLAMLFGSLLVKFSLRTTPTCPKRATAQIWAS